MGKATLDHAEVVDGLGNVTEVVRTAFIVSAVFVSACCEVTTLLVVLVEIDAHAGQVASGHAKVHDRDVDEDLPSFVAEVSEADVREDDEEGAHNRKGGREPHHRSQDLALVLERRSVCVVRIAVHREPGLTVKPLVYQ